MAAAPIPEPAKKLRIAEIFSSIQGEGQWLGTPSTFIRISGCNLRCAWCDTPYASWSPEGPILDLSEILDQVGDHGQNHVVLTGGEPMLFDPIVDLAFELKAKGHIVTIETAGTIYRDLPCDLMSISPKLSNSMPGDEVWRDRHEATRTNLEALKRLTSNYPHQLKFVVDPEAQDDLPELLQLIHQIDARPEHVLLMAEGRDPAITHRKERLLVPLCMKHGFRLTPRFQLDLFGDTRGT